MNLPSVGKRIFRFFGIEIKRVAFGLDPLLDLQKILGHFPSQTIIDVGAHDGRSALKFAKIAPSAKIWSFEPNERVFEALVARTRHNPNITPVALALGSASRRATLNITAASVNTSLLEYNNPVGTDRVVGQVEVEVSTLTAFCREKNIDNISILKVDAQGFDLEVLRGAKELLESNKVGAVYVEVMFEPSYTGQAYFEDIFRALTSCHMKFAGFYGVMRENDYHVHWADALFVNPICLKDKPYA